MLNTICLRIILIETVGSIKLYDMLFFNSLSW